MRITNTPTKAACGAAALLLATACNSGTPASQGKAETLDFTDLATTTPAGSGDAGTIRWNLPYEPLSLDPIKSFNYAENTALANSCEALLRSEPDFGVGPALAESWDNPSPTRWVYQIREGVTFWNGHELTAEDVAWSIGRNLDPDSGTYLGKFFANVESIKATGPLEVTFELSAPDAMLNQQLAAMSGIVTEKSSTQAAGEDFGTPQHLPMCTGPFRFDSWDAGTSIKLSRFDDYWDESLRAKSSKLELSFVADESTSVLALSNGEMDGQFFYTPPAGLDRLRSSGQGSVVMGDSLISWTLIGAATDGPFADPRLRQALSLAVDREAIATAVFQGAAIPAKALAAPASWTYATDAYDAAYDALPETTADLDAAKALVEQAGSPSEQITIAVQGSSAVHEQTANLLQAAGKAIGLDVTIRTVPVEQYGNIYVDPNARKGVDAFLSTYYGVADPLDSYSMFTTGDFSNYNAFTEVEDQVTAARSELDEAKRAELVIGIQEKVVTEAAWTPLEYLPVILFQGDRITGATASSNYLYYPWAAAIGTK